MEGMFGLQWEDVKRRIHPAQKPTQLLLWFIRQFSKKAKSIIVDPFLGSGSTLIACEKTKHVCYGIEIDPYYCDVIVQRWEQFTGNKARLLNGK